MVAHSPFASEILFRLGPIPVATSVVTTWAIMAALTFTCWLGLRRPGLHGGPLQSALEVIVETVGEQIASVLRRPAEPFLPLLGTLFLFLAAANLSDVVPGATAPTAHLETPAALALVVFFAVHFYGLRGRGLRAHLASYLEPNFIMLPLNVVAELTRAFSLTIRLFGNIMSHEFVLAVVLSLAGLFVPVPLMVFSVFIGLVQAYIFTTLATVFVGAALGASEKG
jgi:F-type H+-transporting ATPase subunit a